MDTTSRIAPHRGSAAALHPPLWSRSRLLRECLSPGRAIGIGTAMVLAMLAAQNLVAQCGAQGALPGDPHFVLAGVCSAGSDSQGFALSDIVGALVVAPLAVAAFIDSVRHLLPDPLLMLAAGAALANAFVLAAMKSTPWIVVGAVALGGCAVLAGSAVARLTSLGRGDAKLLGVMGLWLHHLDHLLLALAVAAVGAGLWAVCLLLARRATMTSAIALGPWLVAGASAAWIAAP